MVDEYKPDPCPRCGIDWNKDYNEDCPVCMEEEDE